MNFSLFKTERFQKAVTLVSYFPLIGGGLRLLRKGFDLPMYWQGVPVETWGMVVIFICLWVNPRPLQTFLEGLYKTLVFQFLLYVELITKEHMIRSFQTGEPYFHIVYWTNIYLVTSVLPKLWNEHILLVIVFWCSILKFFFTLDRLLMANIDWDTMVENQAPLTFETILKAQTVLVIPYSPYLSENLKTRSFPYLQRQLVESQAKLSPDLMQKVRRYPLPEIEVKINLGKNLGVFFTWAGLCIANLYFTDKKNNLDRKLREQTAEDDRMLRERQAELDRELQERRADLDRISQERQAELDRMTRERQAELIRKLRQEEFDTQRKELNMQKEDLDFRKQEFEANQRSFLDRFWGRKVQPKSSSAADLPSTKASIVEVQKGSPKDGDFNCVLEPQLDLWSLLNAWV
uniref:MtORFvar2 ortholog n=2 Tax=Heterosigma akashiwo TaxID=2829 RepID=A0A2Z6FJA3_HETAK|nr:MtORFvar2 ortholog [Heterosigma akashiwo]BBE28069.1 MtORFvar2 ortholog [Heterosigma akashiwo]